MYAYFLSLSHLCGYIIRGHWHTSGLSVVEAMNSLAPTKVGVCLMAEFCQPPQECYVMGIPYLHTCV